MLPWSAWKQSHWVQEPEVSLQVPSKGRTDEADLTHEVDSMMNHMTNDSARHRYNISDDVSLKSNLSFMSDKYYKYVFNTVYLN